MSEETRRCTQCQLVKPLREFGVYRYGRDGHRAYCKPCNAEQNRIYRRDNRAKIYAKNARRRALKLGLTPDWCTPGTEAYAEIQATYVTAEALADATGLEFHVDHIVGLSNGGQHRPDNLRPLRADHNIAKGSRMDWSSPEPVFHRVSFVTFRN